MSISELDLSTLGHLNSEELFGGWVEALSHCHDAEQNGQASDPDQIEALAQASIEVLKRMHPEVLDSWLNIQRRALLNHLLDLECEERVEVDKTWTPEAYDPDPDREVQDGKLFRCHDASIWLPDGSDLMGNFVGFYHDEDDVPQRSIYCEPLERECAVGYILCLHAALRQQRRERAHG